MFAYCRSKPVRNAQYLQSQTRHAKRLDENGKKRIRPDARPMAGIAWVCDPSPDADRRDYMAAFKALKKRLGASERANAQIGIHIDVGVSPEWIAETGDVHDPKNPRNRQLIEAAVRWANGWSGGGCYAARLDLDENGSGIVDIFVAPTAMQRHKSGKEKRVVSVNKALDALAVKCGWRQGRHYAALNTDWALYAQANLDPRLERGTPKSQTGKRHIPPDQYRAMMQEARARLLSVQERERDVLRQQTDMADQRLALENADAELAVREEAVTRHESGFRKVAARFRALLEQLADHVGIGARGTMQEALAALEAEAARIAPPVEPFSAPTEQTGPEAAPTL